MQGKKHYQEKLFNSFQLSNRVPKENFYYRLKEVLDLNFLYPLTKDFYGKSGQQSIDPVVFFKLCLVGYLENLIYDRKLVSQCSLRLDILYFLNYEIDEELPWHSTISRTRKLFPETVFEEAFNRVLHLCVESGMVSGHSQAIDSAPVKANASMHSLELKVPQESSQEHLKKVKELNPTTKAGIEKKEVEKSLELKAVKREEPLKIKRKKNPSKGANNKTHYSPNDPDARISVKPGKAAKLNYHCSLSVDTAEHVITDVKAYHADKNDGHCLQDIVIRTNRRLRKEGLIWENVLADTNYSNGENYRFLEEQGLESFIPTTSAYKGYPKDFTYKKEENYFLCSQGKKVVYKGRYSEGGRYKDIYLTSRHDCNGCPIKEQCLGKALHKRIKITPYRDEYERNNARINSKRGRYMKGKRQSTVEPVLGTLKEYGGLGKINTIGIEKANKRMHMAAIAYNLKKYLKFIKTNVKTGANMNQKGALSSFQQKMANLESFLASLSINISSVVLYHQEKRECHNGLKSV